MKEYQTPTLNLVLYEAEVYLDIFELSKDNDFDDNGDWE
jgi:hypothetical protein